MIFLIGGDNFFQSRASVKKHIQEFQHKNFTLKSAYINDEVAFNTLLVDMGSVGMFGGSTLYVIKGFDEASKANQELLEKIVLQTEEELVIWSRKALDKRTKLYKWILKNGTVESFENPKSADALQWIKQFSKENSLILENWMTTELVNRFGSDFSVLASEIDKLKALNDEGIVLDRNSFENIISKSVDTNVWEFVDTLGSRNKSKGLAKLDALLSVFDYEYLVVLIFRQIRLLFLVANFKNKNDLVECGIHPFVATKLLMHANLVPLEKIKRIYQKLIDMEIAVKTGKIDKALALDLLIIAI